MSDRYDVDLFIETLLKFPPRNVNVISERFEAKYKNRMKEVGRLYKIMLNHAVITVWQEGQTLGYEFKDSFNSKYAEYKIKTQKIMEELKHQYEEEMDKTWRINEGKEVSFEKPISDLGVLKLQAYLNDIPTPILVGHDQDSYKIGNEEVKGQILRNILDEGFKNLKNLVESSRPVVNPIFKVILIHEERGRFAPGLMEQPAIKERVKIEVHVLADDRLLYALNPSRKILNELR